MEIIRGVIVNADEYKTDEIISPNKIEAEWVAVDDMIKELEIIKHTCNGNDKAKYHDLVDDLITNLNTASNENKNEADKQ